MLLWRLWDRQIFLRLTLTVEEHFSLLPDVTAVAYVVVVGWACGTALRFYHGGMLMSNLLSFFTMGQVFGFYAAALIIPLLILGRNLIIEAINRRIDLRPPPGVS
jgi:hypothetical protein